MTTQLPPRERPDARVEPEHQSPDVLFEEARRRRRRRWMVGSALTTAVIIAGILTLGMAGGGGGEASGNARDHRSGPGAGAGSGHATASKPFPGAPATEGYYTGPGASCALAPRSHYLPPWSGCVSTMVADVTGDGRSDLVLAYSRLSHRSLGGLPRRTIGRHAAPARYPALQAMLRVVTPGGHITTIPITYWTIPFNRTPAQLERAAAAALISVAHVNSAPGKTIFLQTGQISSGSLALVYSLYHGRLVSSSVVLGYGGDGGTRASFQCLSGNPPQLVQHTYQLVRLVHEAIYGWWADTTTTYAWHGPQLIEIAQSTAERRAAPIDTVGRGCVSGIA